MAWTQPAKDYLLSILVEVEKCGSFVLSDTKRHFGIGEVPPIKLPEPQVSGPVCVYKMMKGARAGQSCGKKTVKGLNLCKEHEARSVAKPKADSAEKKPAGPAEMPDTDIEMPSMAVLKGVFKSKNPAVNVTAYELPGHESCLRTLDDLNFILKLNNGNPECLGVLENDVLRPPSSQLEITTLKSYGLIDVPSAVVDEPSVADPDDEHPAVDESNAQVDEPVVAEPIEEPVDEPVVEERAEEPVDEPVSEPVEEKVVEEPAAEPVEEITPPVVIPPVVIKPIVTKPVVTKAAVVPPVVAPPVTIVPPVIKPVVPTVVVPPVTIVPPVAAKPTIIKPVTIKPVVTTPVATPVVTTPAVTTPPIVIDTTRPTAPVKFVPVIPKKPVQAAK
jgi:hypothetical protein